MLRLFQRMRRRKKPSKFGISENLLSYIYGIGEAGFYVHTYIQYPHSTKLIRAELVRDRIWN